MFGLNPTEGRGCHPLSQTAPLPTTAPFAALHERGLPKPRQADDSTCGHYTIPGEDGECWTGIKTGGGDYITAFVCAITSQELSVHQSTVVTLSASEDEGSVTALVSTIDDIKTSAQEDVEAPLTPTTTRQTSTSRDSTEGGDGTRQTVTASPDTVDSSQVPVGAIVGGVLGGLALIALVGFGIWFIRHKKRQSVDNPNTAPSMEHQPQPVAFHQQQPIAGDNPPNKSQYSQLSVSTPVPVEAKSPSSSPHPTSQPMAELPNTIDRARSPSELQ
ncbi:hypothetical protein FSARC_4768 [Fusarium sarcochroum]|uniref:Mid2 domain-containing protein n=1 Tax=Fusarium sarcochroum TaxID=1208366 RepID=A0A8H4U0W3_9HYPO|nr:hypothetical protein FSARC_4768 [Fusarium sarcochroum]